MQLNIVSSFAGTEETTILNAYIIVQNSSGVTKSTPLKISSGQKDWTYNSGEAALNVNNGDTVYVSFSNAGEGAASGNFDITYTLKCQHVWDDGTVVAATCSTDGTKTYTCGICQSIKVESLTERPQHVWDNGTVVEATCFADGVKTYTCQNCPETKTESLTERPEHNIGGEWLSDNEKHWQSCQVEGCTQIGTKSEHNFVETGEVITQPTSETEGVMKTKCSICDRESTTSIPTLTHLKGTEYGKDTQKHWLKCSVAEHGNCDAVFEKTNHSYTNELTSSGVAATCALDGKSVWQCVCGATEERVISKEGVEHTYTYTSKNETQHDALCSVCQDAKIENHEIVDSVTTPPTYTTKGVVKHACSKCDYEVSEDIHFVADFKKDFTLTEQTGAWSYGSIEYTWASETFVFTQLTTFEVDTWKSGESIEIKKGWAKFDTMGAIAYTAPANMVVTANIKFVGSQDATRLTLRVAVKHGDSTSKPEFKDMQSNTLTVEKVYSLSQGDIVYFMFNGETGWKSGNLDITFTAHYLGDWQHDSGNTKHFKNCSLCGETKFLESEHAWNDGVVTTDSTCAATGIKTFTCTVCGTTKTEEIAIKPHTWNNGEITTQPTNSEAGVKTYTCTVEGCGQTKTEVLPELGHEQGSEFGFDDTNHWFKCSAHTGESACTAKFAETAHSWNNGEVTTEATLYANGLKTYTCSVCNHTKTETIPMKNSINFKDDFTPTTQTGAWSYGKANYSWDGGEHFDFVQSTNFEVDTWKDDGVQIKNDWIDAGGNTTIACTFTQDIKLRLYIKFDGGMENTRVITRIGVKNVNGELLGTPVGVWFGNDNRNWEDNKDYDFKAGDTIYIIFFNEGANKGLTDPWPNGNIVITFTKIQEQA